MSLYPPSDHVITSALDLAVEFRVLDTEEAQTIRLGVLSKFTHRRSGPMWHNLVPHDSFQDRNGWKTIDLHLRGEPFILLFDEAEDKVMIEFGAGARFVPILDDCPGFEFYLTNRETTYLLCFNDHDFLTGTGSVLQNGVLPRMEAL